MVPSIGVNLRVTGHCSQGGRKYMEDMFSVAYQRTPNERELEYAFFGIFDGHGGREAATFAKEHLLDSITNQKCFWSDKDEDILRAIREGFLQTHDAMWGELDRWPKTASGLPSTSGTTATIAFIRRGKIFIGHVGDSSIVLGYQDEDGKLWKGRPLTRDHKPESKEEIDRIQRTGGKVIAKSGVPRVVWNRPRLGHQGPVRRSTHIDEIPFLAVARSLGDLWSYNPTLDSFVVSPEPDLEVVPLDVGSHRCLIFGTDGLWNVLSPSVAVSVVQSTELYNEKNVLRYGHEVAQKMWVNPSKSLVDRALDRWAATRLRADNTSAITLLLDPPGPPLTPLPLALSQQLCCHSLGGSEPRSIVLLHSRGSGACYDPTGGVAIFTRFPVPVPVAPDSSSSPAGSSSGRVCRVGDALHRRVLPVAVSSVQINEVSSSKPERDEETRRESPQKPTVSLVRQKSFLYPGGASPDGFSSAVGYKRRHSTLSKHTEGGGGSGYEPCQKRRTRSEDKRLSAPPTDEELNASDAENERVAWPPKWNVGVSTSKMEHHKRIAKALLSRVLCQGSRLNVLRPPGYLGRENTRTLRSDTAAAKPIRTLRSRNVDTSLRGAPGVLRHSYGPVVAGSRGRRHPK